MRPILALELIIYDPGTNIQSSPGTHICDPGTTYNAALGHICDPGTTYNVALGHIYVILVQLTK
jgi:hypothetical protein